MTFLDRAPDDPIDVSSRSQAVPGGRTRNHHAGPSSVWIAAEDHVDGLSGSKFSDLDWAFLLHLRAQGRTAPDTWFVSQCPDLAMAQSA